MVKIYFHRNIAGFSNCYVIANDKTNEAIIIDPCQITKEIIEQIEENHFMLRAIFVTHNHESNVNGIKTLQKIYSTKIYGADWEIAGAKTTVITGKGIVRIAGLTVHYMALPGHTSDSMAYKIGNVIFIGDALSAGSIGETTSAYADKLLRTNIEQQIFSQQDDTIIMPAHGPPTCVGAEKLYNADLSD